MDQVHAITVLAALAQATRLQVFRALVVAAPEGLTPGDLTRQLLIPATTLTFHLKALLHAGLVTQQRQSRLLIYRAQLPRVDSLAAFLTEDCCGGRACRLESQTRS